MINSQSQSSESFPNPIELLAEYEVAVENGWQYGHKEWLEEKLAGIEIQKLRAKIAYENSTVYSAVNTIKAEQKHNRITWDKEVHCRTGEPFENEFDYVIHQNQFRLPIIATNQTWKDDINPFDDFENRLKHKVESIFSQPNSVICGHEIFKNQISEVATTRQSTVQEVSEVIIREYTLQQQKIEELQKQADILTVQNSNARKMLSLPKAKSFSNYQETVSKLKIMEDKLIGLIIGIEVEIRDRKSVV